MEYVCAGTEVICTLTSEHADPSLRVVAAGFVCCDYQLFGEQSLK